MVTQLDDWQLQATNWSERGEHVLRSGIWSDCQFLVGDGDNQQVFNGHRLLLAMASPVFATMFFGNMPENNLQPIPILDVQPEAFKALFEYIYVNKVILNSFDQACELCYAAKKYMMPHLVRACTLFLWTDLYPGNACRAYEFAKLFEEAEIMEKAMKMFREKTKEVITDASFDSADLSTVVLIFSEDDLKIDSEMELFDVLSRYASKNPQLLETSIKETTPKKESTSTPEEKSESEAMLMTSYSRKRNEEKKLTIRDALAKIRFLTLTPQQFTDGPATSNLLSNDEKLSLLLCLSSSDQERFSLPTDFSKSREPRRKANKEKVAPIVRRLSSRSEQRCKDFETELDLMLANNATTHSSTPFSNFFCQLRNSPLTRSAVRPDSSYPDESDEDEPVWRDVSIRGSESNRAQPKFYCTRHYLLSGNQMHSRSQLDCVISFIPDRNVCIHGIQVTSQVPLEITTDRHTSDTYPEMIYAYLADADGARLTYLHYTQRVNFSTFIDLTFNRQIYVQKNKTYRISAAFMRPGVYPLGICLSHEFVENVNFNFQNLNADYEREGLIRSIIFSI